MRKITRGVFFSFLKKHECFKEYLAACNKTRKSHNISCGQNLSLREFLQFKNVMNKDNLFNLISINCAFSWNNNQREPPKMPWNFINNLWVSFLQNNNFI